MALTTTFTLTRFLRMPYLCKFSNNFQTSTRFGNEQSFILQNSTQNKQLCTKSSSAGPGKQSNTISSEQPKKRKTLTSPQITLILPEENIVSTTLENAEKMANRRNLKLVKIIDFDTKFQKPLYKLMTSQEFFEEDAMIKERKKKEKGFVKEEKFYNILSRINEHDLHVKISQMIKLLKKKHAIHINVSLDGNLLKAEEIGKTIVEELEKVSVKKTFQKKKNLLKFYFIPIEDTSKDVISQEVCEKKDN